MHSVQKTGICLAVIALVAAGAGVAEQEQPGAKHGRERAARGFKAMDTDGDGTITLAEFKTAHANRMQARKERLGDKWKPEREARMPTAEEQFKELDADGDGLLTPEEMRRGQLRRRESAPQREGRRKRERLRHEQVGE